MKLTVLQEDLLKNLLSASHFISSRPQLPVLANILLTTDKNKLKLSSTDLELGISLQVGAKIEREGKITIPARMIVELISNLPAGQIILEEKQGSIVLSTPSFSATINGIPGTEFPTVPDTIEKSNFSISRDILDSLANQIVFAAAVDDSRPVLTGLLFTFGEKGTCVATDGFRLSLKEVSNIDIKNKNTTQLLIRSQALLLRNQALLIPARAIDEVYKVFQNTPEISVRVDEKEKRIVFGGENGVLSSKLLEGEFPDYLKIIPVKWNSRAVVSKDEFTRAVKTTSVFAREAAGVVRVGFKNGRLRLASESKQYGNEEIFVDSKTEGDEAEVAYNYRYVLEFLESVSGDEISIETEGATSPSVFQDTKDQTYKHLIMPVRIQA